MLNDFIRIPCYFGIVLGFASILMGEKTNGYILIFGALNILLILSIDDKIKNQK